MSPAVLAVPAALLSLVLAGCSGDGDGSDGAGDPGPGPRSSEPAPAETPAVGSHPSFEPDDYTYTLVLACYCVGAATPVDVTVRDGEVTAAVYAGDGRGVEAGTPADQVLWLTINDVINQANDTTAASVQVDWPDGQDYPSSVDVDPNLNTEDDERGYHVSNVVVG